MSIETVYTCTKCGVEYVHKNDNTKFVLSVLNTLLINPIVCQACKAQAVIKTRISTQLGNNFRFKVVKEEPDLSFTSFIWVCKKCAYEWETFVTYTNRLKKNKEIKMIMGASCPSCNIKKGATLSVEKEI